MVSFGQNNFGPVGSGSTSSNRRGEAAQGVEEQGEKTTIVVYVIERSDDVA